MEHTRRKAEGEENELVSPKEYFSNNFPYNKAFCLHCQKFIANIYSTQYHIKKPNRKNFLESLYDPSVIRSNTLLNPRHCQYRDFLVHSFNPLNFQVKTLKSEIFFVRCFNNGGHQDLHLVEVKINYMMLTVAK